MKKISNLLHHRRDHHTTTGATSGLPVSHPVQQPTLGTGVSDLGTTSSLPVSQPMVGSSLGQNPVLETTTETLTVSQTETPMAPLETGMRNLSMAAPIVDVEQRELPTVVKETVIPQERIEVQPIIHRDIEQTEVREVVQPIREREITPTEVLRTTLPSSVLPEVHRGEMPIPRATILPETFVAPISSEQVERAPIIEETIHKRIIEEVQPVLYKEVVRPVLVEQVRPVYEKIVEAPVVIREERTVRDLGVRGMGTEYSTTGGWPTSTTTTEYSSTTTGGWPTSTMGGLPTSTSGEWGGLPTSTTGGWQTSTTGGLPTSTTREWGGLPTSTTGGLPTSTTGGLPTHSTLGSDVAGVETNLNTTGLNPLKASETNLLQKEEGWTQPARNLSYAPLTPTTRI